MPLHALQQCVSTVCTYSELIDSDVELLAGRRIKVPIDFLERGQPAAMSSSNDSGTFVKKDIDLLHQGTMSNFARGASWRLKKKKSKVNALGLAAA